jgi:hypothetical protein
MIKPDSLVLLLVMGVKHAEVTSGTFLRRDKYPVDQPWQRQMGFIGQQPGCDINVQDF